MSTGKLIAIVGPSGVGKGTIVRSLQQRHPEIYLSVSATTRQPRPGEVEGKIIISSVNPSSRKRSLQGNF